jgi:hypothetical protein
MVVMEYYKNGSVFDIIHKAEVEMGGMSSPTQQSAALMVSCGFRGHHTCTCVGPEHVGDTITLATAIRSIIR